MYTHGMDRRSALSTLLALPVIAAAPKVLAKGLSSGIRVAELHDLSLWQPHTGGSISLFVGSDRLAEGIDWNPLTGVADVITTATDGVEYGMRYWFTSRYMLDAPKPADLDFDFPFTHADMDQVLDGRRAKVDQARDIGVWRSQPDSWWVKWKRGDRPCVFCAAPRNAPSIWDAVPGYTLRLYANCRKAE